MGREKRGEPRRHSSEDRRQRPSGNSGSGSGWVPGSVWGGVGKESRACCPPTMGDNKKVDNQQLKNFMSKSHDLERTGLQENKPGGKLDEKDHFPETLKLPRWR